MRYPHRVLDRDRRRRDGRAQVRLHEQQGRTGQLQQRLDAGRRAAERLAADGALELTAERAVLTLRGRLTADAVVRDLTD